MYGTLHTVFHSVCLYAMTVERIFKKTQFNLLLLRYTETHTQAADDASVYIYL